MREGVTYKRLIDVCGIQYGFAFDSKCFTSDDSYPPIIRIRDVVRGYSNTYYSGEINERYYVEKGDYLIGMDGEFNIATWQSDKALLNQRVCKIYSIDANTSIRYIYYALRKVLKQIEDETPFVTVKHLSASRLNKVSIALPPLSTQELIVRELDSISSVISAKKQQVLELDNLAQAIFLDTFGDPITNPKGWGVKKMSEACDEIFAGGDVPKGDSVHEKDAEHTIPIYSNGVKDEGLYGYTSKARVLSPAVTISGRGTIGAAFIRREPFFPIIRLIVAIPNKSLDLTYFGSSIKMLSLESTGNSIQQLTIPMIKEYTIPLPPLSLQQAFAEKVQVIEEQKRLINQSIAEFESLLAQRMEFHFA